MEWLRRWALGAGLVGGLGWAAAVSMSMPDWLDPADACARMAGAESSGGVRVRTGWLPPSAQCDFGGGDIRAYISTERSILLSVIGLAVLALLGYGAAATIQRLTGPAGMIRTADEIDLRRRHRNHLFFGALDVLIATALIVFLNTVAIVFGQLAGGLLFALTAITALGTLAALLDRHVGPLPSTNLAGRRRGALAGALTFAAIFVATALTGDLPFFPIWTAPLAAITYATVVHLQWTRAANHPSHQPSDR
ncbi:hypothetical protein HPO96_28470 [Kribbella sandramycini]|uniref:Uncharacterized protein n=1 Tax=Kribbella sandramycini TaxID=60450 RepID=A0A7Y4L4I6_9ACTN|nr:hypothetical protein [Kribbella sandramycini]MBB6571540.1 hypothetical protein [Kribbella sandramycini]NOL44189.1 hypothetical protein [Kribbella sandramycini]